MADGIFNNGSNLWQQQSVEPEVADEVLSTDAGYWQQRNADLLRAQWDYSQQQFGGVEDQFTSLLTDPTKRAAMHQTSLDYVSDSVDQSYAGGLGQLARRDQRYGVGLGALQKQSRANKMQQSAAATKAKGLTDMAGYLKDRDTQILSGGITAAVGLGE